MKSNAMTKSILGMALLAAWSAPARQAGWPQCADVSSDDFTVEKIVTRDKDNAHSPIKLDFHQVEKDGKVYTNFYFNELHTGKVRYYDEATNSVTDAGQVVGGKFGGKDTFSGLVLDPDFENNRWIYLNYSGDGFFRLARYTIAPDNTLDQSSMKVLMDIPKKNGEWHGECAIDFDAYGDLWIGIGDNGTHNSNDANYGLSTADYRASVLRIHPEDDGTYSIPGGNMGDYWSKQFEAMGRGDLAAEYADPKIVLPEIYVKGVRNPYTLKVVHPTNRWVAFGDVGPDFGKVTEEFNILQKPGFAGWPIWAGVEPHKKPSGADINIEGITTISSGSSRGGASGLPPVIRSQYDVRQSSAMAGPIYWYDGSLQSDRKFPAYYHGKWFVADNDESGWGGPPWVKIVTLNEDYTEAVSDENFFGFTKERIQDMWFGPDGALYIAYFYKPWFGDNADNEIVRISYNGTGNENCLPTELIPPFAIAAPIPVSPDSGAQSQPLDPRLAWHRSQGADSYRLQVYRDEDLTDLLLDTTLGDTALQLGELEYESSYRWQVRASNRGGESPWTGVWKFTTVPAAPAFTSHPEDTTVAEGQSATFLVSATGSSLQYQWQENDVDIPEATSSSYTTPATTLADSGDVFQCIVSNAGGALPSNPAILKVLPAPPGTVRLLAPSNGAGDQSTAGLSATWNRDSLATGYQVQLATTSDFAQPLLLDATTEDTARALDTLSPGTTYWLRVRGKNSGGETPWTTHRFTTVPESPGAPVLFSPDSGAQSQPLDPRLAWHRSQGADSYRLQVYRDEDLTDLLLDTTLGDTALQLSELEYESSYRWRVLAANAGGAGDWSSDWMFITTEATSSVEKLRRGTPRALNLTVAAREVAGSFTFMLSVPSGDMTEVRLIWPATGKSQTLLHQYLNPGYYRLGWSGKHRAPGVAVYLLRSGKAVRKGRILLTPD